MKRGTAVRGISLVPDNAQHIEGRVEGQRIVILTQFVKKLTDNNCYNTNFLHIIADNLIFLATKG